MPDLTLTGDNDPFLHVHLRRGESIFCESDAMVMMEDNLDLTARVQGGLLQAAFRSLANGESFFQQQIKAVRGDGDCLLAPTLPGAMQVLDVGAQQYCIADEAYVAATENVDVKAHVQNLGGALLGRTGGFLIGRTEGVGQLVVSGFGTLFTLDVDPGRETIIDNGHVVAWDARLSYRLSASTSKSSGLLGNLVNSQFSGEGVVLRFSGAGKVIICSRNRSSFAQWMVGQLPRS